ncbi:MAG TPA: hypothetical protein VG709_03240 [Actinomycetota bacterium]|nr:hypothetical protein [Actinomycetota bacterium]
MQRRSSEEIASAVVAAPVALALLFAAVLMMGVLVLVLSLTYGARAETAACPAPDEVAKDARRADVAPGAKLAPASAAPLVSATDAWGVACGEPGAREAARSPATYGLISGPAFGIEAPGKPVWVVAFDDACVPTEDGCRATDLAVVVDALSGERIASLPRA